MNPRPPISFHLNDQGVRPENFGTYGILVKDKSKNLSMLGNDMLRQAKADCAAFLGDRVQTGRVFCIDVDGVASITESEDVLLEAIRKIRTASGMKSPAVSMRNKILMNKNNVSLSCNGRLRVFVVHTADTDPGAQIVRKRGDSKKEEEGGEED